MKGWFKYSLSKVGLPLVVSSSKPNLCFLVDTGASHNILFTFVVESSNIDYKSLGDNQSISGIEGTEHVTPQVEMSLSFDNKQVVSTFSILDATTVIRQIQNESGIQIHGILGIPFLMQNEWILDFKQLTISN